MITRTFIHSARQAPRILVRSKRPVCQASTSSSIFRSARNVQSLLSQSATFHTSHGRWAQSPTADALMENINDLYATAKDEFEIAVEETEGNTVYAADDRDAARKALGDLKNAFEKASKEADPAVAKEVQSRVGPRIRELENAVTALEEKAMEEH